MTALPQCRSVRRLCVTDCKLTLRVLRKYHALWDPRDPDYRKKHSAEMKLQKDQFLTELLKQEKDVGRTYWKDLTLRYGNGYWPEMLQRLDNILNNMTRMLERRARGETNPRMRVMVGCYSLWRKEKLDWLKPLMKPVVVGNRQAGSSSLIMDVGSTVTPAPPQMPLQTSPDPENSTSQMPGGSQAADSESTTSPKAKATHIVVSEGRCEGKDQPDASEATTKSNPSCPAMSKIAVKSQNRQEEIVQHDTVEAPKRRRITQPVSVAVVRTRKKVDLSRDKSHMAQSLAAIFCEGAEFIGTAEVNKWIALMNYRIVSKGI